MPNAREILIHLHNTHKGEWLKIYNDIANKVSLPDTLNLEGADNFITLVDDDYPLDLKQSYQPPFVITKEQAEMKRFILPITFIIEAHTLEQAKQKALSWDFDMDDVEHMGEVRLAEC